MKDKEEKNNHISLTLGFFWAEIDFLVTVHSYLVIVIPVTIIYKLWRGEGDKGVCDINYAHNSPPFAGQTLSLCYNNLLPELWLMRI